MGKTRHRVAGGGLVVVLVGAGLSACVGDEPTTSPRPPDASLVDGTATEAASADARAPGCLSAPIDTAGEPEFCAFEKRYFERCGNCQECRQRNLNECASFGAGLSEAFKGVLTRCVERLKCVEFKDIAGDPCFDEQLPKVQFSAAQLAVKDAYCAACPGQTEACATFFSRGADGGGGLTGGTVAIMNDELATKVKNECVRAINCNPSLFLLCSAAKMCEKFKGRDNCDTAFCP